MSKEKSVSHMKSRKCSSSRMKSKEKDSLSLCGKRRKDANHFPRYKLEHMHTEGQNVIKKFQRNILYIFNILISVYMDINI